MALSSRLDSQPMVESALNEGFGPHRPEALRLRPRLRQEVVMV